MSRESIRLTAPRPVAPHALPVEDGECWAPDETDDLREAAGLMFALGVSASLVVVGGVFWLLITDVWGWL